jgi:hypothetical protein
VEPRLQHRADVEAAREEPIARRSVKSVQAWSSMSIVSGTPSRRASTATSRPLSREPRASPPLSSGAVVNDESLSDSVGRSRGDAEARIGSRRARTISK